MMKEQRQNSQIRNITARQVLDSRGNPTVEVEVTTGDGVFRAACPAETSSKLEAVSLRDGDRAWSGKSVSKAVANVASLVLHPLVGVSVQDQSQIDALLSEIDGTSRFELLGANVAFPVSAACCLAGAANARVPLWKFIAKAADTKKCSVPVPLVSVMQGGPSSQNTLPFNDLMIAPFGATAFFEAAKVANEMTIDIQKQLAMKGVTEEGGQVPKGLKNIEDYLEVINQTIHNSALEGKCGICIDCSSKNFVIKQKDSVNKYDLGYKKDVRNYYIGTELADYYVKLIQAYPILSLQDPFDAEEFETYAYFKKQLEKNNLKVQIFVDDMTQSQQDMIHNIAESKIVNGCLIKPNQAGTVTNAINAFKTATAAGWKALVHARYGDTADCFLSHFSVGVSSELIQVGGFQRSERTSKINELLRIEECGEVVYGCQDWVQQ
ncbi:Enolase [Hexamita inflata]|uniref:phosphopyruvate hydratase n=1 Tax=Hexamita inflata TaxID=28002 RepID=A0AA86NXQ2_9EUKA|nr:Enolase [Hexamita inflata]